MRAYIPFILENEGPSTVEMLNLISDDPIWMLETLSLNIQNKREKEQIPYGGISTGLGGFI